MPFTYQALDTYVAQGISNLSQCDAPDLAQEFDESEYWVNNFILNSIFRASVSEDIKPFVFSILRRAQMAIVEYENGRTALIDYINGKKERVSVYFRALYHFELAVSLSTQGYEVVRKLAKKDFFDPDDGTPIQRLYAVNNISKHLEPATISDGHLHAVWITNAGISTSRAHLDWRELADVIVDLGKMADSISDPTSLKADDA